MKFVRVFLILSGVYYISLYPMEVSCGYKPETVIESQVKKVSFLTPELFGVTAPGSQHIWVYELKSKKPKSIIECAGPVNDLSQYDNFKKIIVACYDNVHILDTQTGQQILKYKTNTPRINSVHAHPNAGNIAVAGACDGTIPTNKVARSENNVIKVLDFREKDPVVKQYAEHAAGVSVVRIAGSGDYFVSTSEDKTTKIWDWNLSQSHHTIRNNAAPNDIAYNTQGNRFTMCSHYAYRYDAHNAALLATYNRAGVKELRGSRIEDASTLTSCASTGLDEQELVALGTDDGKIIFFNPENPKAPTVVIKPFEKRVDSLAFCPQGNCLVAGSNIDGRVHVYEVNNKKDRKESPITKRSSIKSSCLP